LSDIRLDNIDTYQITNLIDKQSPDIALGVDIGGAGDQGIIYGYAINETSEYLPLSYMLATRALQKLRNLNHPLLKQDAKAQVTINYIENEIFIDTFLISIQHTENISQNEIYDIVSNIMKETSIEFGANKNFRILVNPTGRFVIGGSFGDCGVTGRKIIADSYGGYAKHGGGAYSGKDYTKVDRSAAYMARFLAKFLLKKFYLNSCEIQLAYVIGMPQPISVNVNFDSQVQFDKNIMIECINRNFDLSPKGIVDFLDLKNVRYYDTAKYGHFTNQNFNWEKVN
jgi:S-adenosylmethionine synthetase